MRYVIYARVSTALEEQKTSFDTQVSDLQARVKLLYPDLEFVGVYGDRGISGTTDERPDFQKMLSDAKEKQFDLIITKSVSRFARNTRILLNTLQELESAKVGVIFLEENIDTRHVTQKFLMTILGALAEMESTNLRSHIKEGFATRRASGKMARPSAISYGYAIKDGEVVVDPDAAEVIRLIFSWFVEENLSCGGIVTRLMERGFSTRRGLTRWNRQTVKYILNNSKYCGQAVEHDVDTGEEFVFDYPQIVSERLFNRAQEIMSQRKTKFEKHISDGKNFSSSLYTLSQITKCAKCGSVCTRYTVHPESPRHHCDLEDHATGHPMWACIHYSGNRKLEQFCDTYQISEQYVYEAIIVVLAKRLARGHYGRTLLERLHEESLSDVQYEKALTLYTTRKSDLETQRKKELTLFRQGLITEAEVTANVKSIDKKISKLKKPIMKSYSGVSKELVDLLTYIEEQEKIYPYTKPTPLSVVDTIQQEIQQKLRVLFQDPDMKRKIVRGLVEEVRIGGEPKYRVEVRLFLHTPDFAVRVSRRAPTMRHGHLLPTTFNLDLVNTKNKKK